MRVGIVLSRLPGERQSGVDGRKRAVEVRPHGFKIGEQTVERRPAAPVAEREIGRQRLLKPNRSAFRVVQLAARPICEHAVKVGVGLQIVLFRQHKQRFDRHPRRERRRGGSERPATVGSSRLSLA